MRWPWRIPERSSRRAQVAQDRAAEALDQARQQAPRVDHVIRVARLVSLRADILRADVEHALRGL